MSQRVLVTGGAGFIGSHMAELLLQRGYQVRIVDNLISGNRAWIPAGVEFFEGDIADADLCLRAMHGVSGIFHMAAMSRVTAAMEHVDLCTQSNIIGTQNLLSAASAVGIKKFVYSGSSTFYGNQPVPHREYETPNEALNFYGLTKMVGEKYCELFNQFHTVPTVILRYFNVYGPRQPQTGTYALVLGIFLERWKKNQPLIIHGDGAQRRDFIHVRDVVNANLLAFESDVRGKIYNVGSGSNISVKELADLISDNQQYGDKRTGDAKETFADITRIQSDLNWKPQVDFKTGLDEMKQRMWDGAE
jgi:UDP-glucose 4-epimerase